ncbi:hypothetical protein [Chitinophaga cymbidii]|uniref:Uncharacterized protein n=1 Tax=Chitinophaga cymbidii TaxID=1096750 RepID=A0A512RKS0_9BACT|nr:hypothetical protein [Chitinophaga cymbidii]GEP96305.1 hypothetical protein CCY01nite_25650 [Chitinophaga cymbidii]
MLKWMMLMCCALPAFAQQKEVARITAVFDSTSVAELYSTTPIGLEIKYADSSVRTTSGLLKGDYSWNRIRVESPDGECRNGVLRFNRNAIRPDNYRIRLLVTLQDEPGNRQHEVFLQLPYLTAIRFRHYTDSLKRGIHFYLNVEGIYNTGRIYPLDTTRVRLYASEGQLIGQDLLIPQKDSVTKEIAVRAVYRGNKQINASSVVPVKQGPEDESLIIENEKDLFRKPGRKKKQ